MKKFVELIQRMHNERYSVVLDKIVAEKIPVAFLTILPIDQAIEKVKDLRARNLNIDNLITFSHPPAISESFKITSLDDISKIHPRPEYIFATDPLDARIAIKYAPDCAVIYPTGRDSEEIYNTFMEHLPELQEAYESLIDEESKKTFCGYLLSSVSDRLGEVVYSNNVHYLLEGFIPKAGDVVIDGGVCDGETAAFFADMGCKVYGFELDKNNFDIAKKLADKKNFVVENFGLGSYRHKINYTPSGSMSKFDSNGTETAEVITLDSYVREKNIQHVDFIKLDVEGAELELLQGSVMTIARFKPVLALSAYHKWDDFWTLMKFVKSIRSDYEFAMRQYTTHYDDAPKQFDNGLGDLLYKLGLDINVHWYNECVLFAR